MGALLESGMVGNIGLKHLRVIKEDTIKKWDELGFLEGLGGHQKDNIAQLYENQASYLINEAAVHLKLLYSQSSDVYSPNCWRMTSYLYKQ